MNINNQCYRHEKISTHNKYDSQILFPNVDMTYVLIMIGSKHEERVRKQLDDYPFTRNIYLQWNYGFKNCSKHLTKQKTDSDLSDAYMIAFNDAIQHNYERILTELYKYTAEKFKLYKSIIKSLGLTFQKFDKLVDQITDLPKTDV